ncbi:hypothetical protein FHL15_011181 [Xylaria flabelliformis]|uniref:Uncharacterized protein n=1 Tax=Xylaria flabelliformis TaxID=2512241 RepID=A0A553HJ05_9PEZI|nr:hypothetical protein FHL15_011181 [Xylaria flabelliformis]
MIDVYYTITGELMRSEVLKHPYRSSSVGKLLPLGPSIQGCPRTCARETSKQGEGGAGGLAGAQGFGATYNSSASQVTTESTWEEEHKDAAAVRRDDQDEDDPFRRAPTRAPGSTGARKRKEASSSSSSENDHYKILSDYDSQATKKFCTQACLLARTREEGILTRTVPTCSRVAPPQALADALLTPTNWLPWLRTSYVKIRVEIPSQ